MTCYHPMIRLETYEKYKCIDGHMAYKAKIIKPDPSYKEEFENIDDFAKSLQGHYRNIQIIPCGKCIGCRLEYSRQWATKGCLEAEQYNNNWFLTLTYDEEHLPEADPAINEKTGEEMPPNPGGTLKSTDLTNFIKKLRTYYERKYNHKGIRFMACGEYGTTSNRAHYHIIFYNLPILEQMIRFHEYNENYEPLYRLTEIEEIWGKGIVVAASVNWNTCAYVARYVTKKIGLPTNKEHYKNLGIEPEFFRMSRKPGIGRQWFEDHKEEIYKKDEIIVNKYGGGTMKVKPPKYYDKLYDIEKPEELKKIKEQRRKDMENINRIRMQQTTKFKKEQLNVEENIKENQAKALIREKV